MISVTIAAKLSRRAKTFMLVPTAHHVAGQSVD